MRNPSQMLRLLLQVAILAAVLAAPSLGEVTEDSKCKCLMCVCDVDPHPLPPALPSHHHPPPPEEPEPEPEPTPVYHYPPPHEEPTPVYYLPPPVQPYGQYPYPSQGQGAYWPPSTPAEMYPQVRGYIRSTAARRRLGHGGLPSSLVVSVLLVSGGLLPLLV
uniref:Uncharacterized protein n=1 Tax=Oryza punctata TaxID=4537 RepID=A0A0E0JKZ2_ORYPU